MIELHQRYLDSRQQTADLKTELLEQVFRVCRIPDAQHLYVMFVAEPDQDCQNLVRVRLLTSVFEELPINQDTAIRDLEILLKYKQRAAVLDLPDADVDLTEKFKEVMMEKYSDYHE